MARPPVISSTATSEPRATLGQSAGACLGREGFGLFLTPHKPQVGKDRGHGRMLWTETGVTAQLQVVGNEKTVRPQSFQECRREVE
jgi:hypothetical protein